jgi:cation diffusion facilitator family transporter
MEFAAEKTTDVRTAMSDHAARKEQAAFWSIIASFVLTLGKLGAAVLSGSLALYSEAAHGLIDVAATSMTWFAVRAADKPADNEHHYGHGKIESLAALIETAMLFALAAYVTWEAITRLLGAPHPVEAHPLAFAVLVIAMGVDAWRWHSLSRIARETKSEALAADALHFSSDLVNSALTLIGLVFVAYGLVRADALATMGVALFITMAGWKLAKRTLGTLLDTAPDGVADHLRELAGTIPGISGVDEVRVRPLGGRLAADLVLAVSRTLPLDRVQVIKDRFSKAAHEHYPDLDLSLRTIPRALSDETIFERVLLIAARRRLPVHHVMVQTVENRLSISLDLEVDGRMSLSAAHHVAEKFENALEEEFGPGTEVETHIEPLTISHLEGHDVDRDKHAHIVQALQQTAKQMGHILNLHNIRVRQTDQGLIVNYHCCFPADTSVTLAHDHVDALERKMRVDYPDILRLVGHAEPLETISQVL